MFADLRRCASIDLLKAAYWALLNGMNAFFPVLVGSALLASGSTDAWAQAGGPMKFRCMVQDAQILPDRTHVRCLNRGMNGLSTFAADTAQPYSSQVVLAVVQSLRTQVPLVITYAPDVELNPEGCDVRNCRKIIDVGQPPVARKSVSAPLAAPLPAPVMSQIPE